MNLLVTTQSLSSHVLFCLPCSYGGVTVEMVRNVAVFILMALAIFCWFMGGREFRKAEKTLAKHHKKNLHERDDDKDGREPMKPSCPGA